MPFEDLIAAWDGEQVIVHFDRLTGSWMFICMHSTTLGPAAGGTRLRAYPSPEDGLADGLRLSVPAPDEFQRFGVGENARVGVGPRPGACAGPRSRPTSAPVACQNSVRTLDGADLQANRYSGTHPHRSRLSGR
jgi:hypothetical protein